jgi:hypothetical protein
LPLHEEYYTIAASKIEGVTPETLPAFIRAASNDHWIWTGSHSPYSKFNYVRYRGLTFNVPQTLSTFPIAEDLGWSAPCIVPRCVNPYHCLVCPPAYGDLTNPVQMLARYGKAYCKTFIPKPMDLATEVVEYAYNPDPDIWAHRVWKILKCPMSTARELIST